MSNQISNQLKWPHKAISLLETNVYFRMFNVHCQMFNHYNVVVSWTVVCHKTAKVQVRPGKFHGCLTMQLQYHCCRQLAEHRYLHQQFQQQVGLSSVLEAMLVAVAAAVYRQLALVASLVDFGHWQFSVGHSASSGISFVSDIRLLPGSNVFWPVSH